MNARCLSMAGLAALVLAVVLVPSFLLVPVATGDASTKDWPQFRGPHLSGTSVENGVLDREPLGLEIAWKRALGSGYSSISISGERGVTLFTDGKDDYLTVFDVASGDELWRYRIAEMYKGHTGSDDGPISTPAIDGGVVYGLGPRGQLFAVQLEDGSEVWSRTLDGEKDSVTPHYGFSTAPLVVGDLVVVQTGGPDGHSVTGYDRSNGEPRWSTADDPVNYQSPTLLELAGRRQVVAINDKVLMGIDPAGGKVLWQHEHGTAALEAFAQPVALGGDRVLVNSLDEVVAIQVSVEGGAFSAEEVWRSTAFKNSYAIPVPHQGHLFGFSGRFLTCISTDSGEVDWKSRPPGGEGLIMVDGKLVIVSPEGELVVASATPGGYVEKARLRVFEDGGMTAPSFANGHIFVRNLKEMAAIRVTDKPVAAKADAVSERELLGEFGDFVRRVEASGDEAALVEKYLGAQESFPIVEKDGLVHFVYQGEVEDIAMTGNLLPFREEAVLHRIAGTDVYFKSLRLDPEAVWEYRFSINFGDTITDPRNPLTIGSLFGPMSELRMPDFEAPDFLGEPEEPRGRLDSFQFRSEIRDGERRIRVYVPVGYDGGEERYPLLVVNLGNAALKMGEMDVVLDNLIAQKKIAPLLAVFVPQGQREYAGPNSADYVRMLAEELVPHLDKHYRTSGEASTRGVMGVIDGGTMSVYAALKAPGTFGKLAAQSLFLHSPFSEELLAAIEESEPQPLDGYVEWRRHDLVVEGFVDVAAGSRQVYEALKAKGFGVRSREVAGAWGWSSWRAELGHILADLYPAED